MSPPLVSVLMPVHNAGPTLAQALGSLRRQTETSWECIAVDDGSSDGSPQCLEGAAREDPRINVLTRAHSGIVESLNAGLARCRGRYVARMDADDLMLRARLQLQVAALEVDSSLAGVGCHVRIFPRKELLGGRLEYEAWLNSINNPERLERDAFIECPLAHPSLMLRRAVLAEYGYRNQGWPEDYDLVLRLLVAGKRLGVVQRRLLCWRDGPNRLSRTSSDYAIERFTACKAHFLARTRLERSSRYVLWGYGKTGRALAKALAALGKHPSAIVEVHPGRVGQNIQGAPVIAPDELPAFARRHADHFIIASVARAAPRAEVRQALDGFGFVELRDYVCAA
jgi:glycosyltransferase involved in cell wall biosynthesis